MQEGIEGALQTVNDAFFFVVDIIVSIQSYFIGAAQSIAYVVQLIAICTIALNYAMTGTGLKENSIKLLKAVLFYFIVIMAYPAIVGWITGYTLDLAKGSVYATLTGEIKQAQANIAQSVQDKVDHVSSDADTFTDEILASEELAEAYEKVGFFRKIFQKHTAGSFTYTAIAPASAVQATFLVAGECFNMETKTGIKGFLESMSVSKLITGLVCGFFVVFTGALCVLEYCVTFLEFMLVTSVGIILFPLSLWEGSKFMTEKLIGAIVGFFMKLLFCNISLFLMLYGFMKIAGVFVQKPFTGAVDQILMLMFSCLFYYFICKSGPGLAQSLLTGAPSLNAAGAIGAVAGAAMSAAAIGGMVKSGTGKAAGAAGAIAGGGSEAPGGSAAGGGQSGGAAAGEAGQSGGAAKGAGQDLTRSLGGGGGTSTGSGGAVGGGTSSSGSGGGTSGGSMSVTNTGGVSSSPIGATSRAGGGTSSSGGTGSSGIFGGAGGATGGGALDIAMGGATGGGALDIAAAAAGSAAAVGGAAEKEPEPEAKESNIEKFAAGFATAAGAHLPTSGLKRGKKKDEEETEEGEAEKPEGGASVKTPAQAPPQTPAAAPAGAGSPPAKPAS